MPPPNVDSAVIQLTLRDEPEFKVKNEKDFFRFVKACFAQRRKTLVNTVSAALGIDKNLIKQALAELDLSETVRAESLSMAELCALSDIIFK
jgi:16S rRNA (adenine1518-N6/adenine1519-N6)-dimethyltransferase